MSVPPPGEHECPTRRAVHCLVVAWFFLFLALVAGFWRVETLSDYGELDRTERITQVNALACALKDDADVTGRVIDARGLPGDDLITASRERLAAAAEAVNPNCPAPEEVP